MKAFIVLIALVSLGAIGCSRSPGYYIDHGNKLFDGGKYDEAALNYRKAIQKEARSGEANFRLGLAELKLGQGAEAYHAFTKADELLPDREDIKVQLGDLVLIAYLSDRQRPLKLYDQLARISRELLAKNPKSFDGLRFQGDLELSDGKFKEAADSFAKANQIRPMEPQVVSLWVEALFKEDEFGQGEKLAQQLIQKHPDYQVIYDLLYNRYMGLGRVADAEALLKEDIRNNPKDKQTFLQLANHYHKLQKQGEMIGTLQKLLDNPSVFPKSHMDVGDFYYSAGDQANALQQFQAGLREDPQDRVSYQKRITNVLIAQKRIDEALPMLDEIIRVRPDDLGSRAMRADLWLNSGKNLDGALREFEDLVKKMPADEVLRFNLGRAFYAKGNFEQARARFLEAAKQKNTYVAPRVELAALGQRRGNYAETLRYANEVRAIDPRQPAGRLWRCVGLTGTGDYQQARSEITSLLRDYPQSIDVQVVAAQLEMTQKRFANAEAVYRKLYKPGAPDLRPLQGVVNAEVSQSHFAPAVQLLTNELRLSPNSSKLHSILANTAAVAGNADLAIKEYQWVIDNNPRDVDAHIRLAGVYVSRGDTNSGLAQLQEAKKLEPQNSQVSQQLAYLEIGGNEKAAIADYRHQLAIAPDDPAAMNNLALLLADTGGNLDEALGLVNKARQKVPTNPSFTDTLAWIYVKKNMNDTAVSVLSDLAKKYPHMAEFRYHLGVALLQKGDKQKAKAELEAGLSQEPPKDVADRIRKAIASI